MKLENWYVTVRNPYLAPEAQVPALGGDVYGDTRGRVDGSPIITSSVKSYKDGKVTTRSGSEYELGKVAEGYEIAFPNALERFRNSFDENGNLRKRDEPKED